MPEDGIPPRRNACTIQVKQPAIFHQIILFVDAVRYRKSQNHQITEVKLTESIKVDIALEIHVFFEAIEIAIRPDRMI